MSSESAGNGDREAPLLRVEDLRKQFAVRGGHATTNTVLDGVSFSVSEGEVVGLVGGSGAGKSTIARLIMGLTRPDGGRIVFEGQELSRLKGRERRAALRRMHLVFQDPYDSLPPSMRVREIVAEPMIIHREGAAAERETRVQAALEAVMLVPAAQFLNRYAHEISGGERQRVALARAVILRPRLIVADEPTSMLDVSLRLELLGLMRRLRDQSGIAYLYITHDLALARAFCDRLIILNQGRLVEEGPAADVIEHPRDPYTAALVRAAEALLPATRLRPNGTPI